jgi:hypothetical protein
MNIGLLLLVVFVYTLLLSFVLRECYWIFTGTPFGVGARNNDAYADNSIAVQAMGKNIHFFLNTVKKFSQYHNDDYGFVTICWLIFSVVGNELAGQYFLILCNALAMVLSTYYLYRLMLFLDICKKYVCLFCTVYALFPYFILEIAIQGKQIFFSLFIIQAFYYMYKYKKNKKLYEMLISVLSAIVSFYFRSAISIILFMSFAILLMTNRKNKKKVLLIIVFFSIISFFLLFILFSYLFSYLGINFIQFLTRQNGRVLRSISSPILVWLLQIVAGFFGPFPNFNRAGFVIMETSGALLKVFISLPLWIGVSKIIKSFNYKYYPIVVFVIINLFVLVIYNKTFDMRYQLVCFPLMLPIIAYTFQNVSRRITHGLLNYGYILFSIGLILAFNNR